MHSSSICKAIFLCSPRADMAQIMPHTPWLLRHDRPHPSRKMHHEAPRDVVLRCCGTVKIRWKAFYIMLYMAIPCAKAAACKRRARETQISTVSRPDPVPVFLGGFRTFPGGLPGPATPKTGRIGLRERHHRVPRAFLRPGTCGEPGRPRFRRQTPKIGPRGPLWFLTS